MALAKEECALQGNPPAWGLVRYLDLLLSLSSTVAYASPAAAPLLRSQGRPDSRGREPARCVLVWRHVSRLVGPLPLVGGIPVLPAPGADLMPRDYLQNWVDCYQ